MQRPQTEEERALMKQGAEVFAGWAKPDQPDHKPYHVCLSLCMSMAMRFAARMNIDEGELKAYVERHYADAVKARQLQQAVGPHTSTLIDGERRIILPMEDPL
jgi:hypothetical protein